MQFLDADSKKPEWSLFISKANHLNGLITVVIQAYAPTSNAEEAEGEWFYEDLQDHLEVTLKKESLFIIGDWNAKVGIQETPGVTGKFGLGVWIESGQRLIKFYQENTPVVANTLFQQHKRRLHMDITRWSTLKSDWLYSLPLKMEKLYTLSINKIGSWDCCSDHELLIAKFIFKSNKVGKTTRPFRYDLNQSPYDYTVEVRNRFKGLDLIDRVPDELWMEVCGIVQETGVKTISMKRNAKRQNV